MLGISLALACIAMVEGAARGCLLAVLSALDSWGEPVGWQCRVSPMALTGTALLWELEDPQQMGIHPGPAGFMEHPACPLQQIPDGTMQTGCR